MKTIGFNTKKMQDVELTTKNGCSEYLNEIFAATAETFRFTPNEQEKFENNEVARLMAAIPFVAGCEDAKRTSLAHISIYVTDLRGGDAIFTHTKDDNDSVFTRLRLLSSFKGGDEKIIHHGMTLLALVMLEGYEQSKDYDVEHNQYNPLNDGAWKYEELKHTLVSDIKENPCTDLDAILPIENRIRAPYWGRQ